MHTFIRLRLGAVNDATLFVKQPCLTLRLCLWLFGIQTKLAWLARMCLWEARACRGTNHEAPSYSPSGIFQRYFYTNKNDHNDSADIA